MTEEKEQSQQEVKHDEQPVPERTESPVTEQRANSTDGVHSDNAESAEHQIQTPTEEPPVRPGAPTLQQSTAHKYEAHDGLTGKKVTLPLDKVTSISRTIYVESIHTPQPIIMDVQFRALGKFRETVLRIDEQTFDALVAKGIKVRYSYVSDFLMNKPEQGQLLQRTYTVDYPEWIDIQDVLEQDKYHARYYAPKLSTELERKLFPDFKDEKKQADVEAAKAEQKLAKADNDVVLPQSAE